jgi:hypothetical protein
MNAGHVHEMQQGRLPYGYIYPKGGVGADVAIYTTPPAQPAPSQDWKALAEEQAETIAKMTSDKYPFVHIRVDASEAEKEGALRSKLIELGWTPPAAQPAPVACLIGAKGSAFDAPKTKRAYTYKEQPGNTVASKLGEACWEASKQPAGDHIDRGLILLRELQKEGFGVFDLGAEYTVAQPAAPNFHAFTAWASGEGYDTAHTHNGEKWVCLNPMTADLWMAWQAAHGITSATPPNPAT